MLASVEQVLAYFLPEAPAEMLQNFDEVILEICKVILIISSLKICVNTGQTKWLSNSFFSDAHSKGEQSLARIDMVDF